MDGLNGDLTSNRRKTILRGARNTSEAWIVCITLENNPHSTRELSCRNTLRDKLLPDNII